ncbi:MAG: potassium/proton antiporter [Bacillota bacterium]|nr:potassium/proton antiporter [Bacillota bacterium]
MTSAGALALLGLALLLGAGVLATRLASRIGIPALLLFLGLGILAGPEGLGWVTLPKAGSIQVLAAAALAFILFEGGLRTQWTEFRQVAWPSLSLATVGVFITALLTALLARWLIDIPWLVALLLGAILASTDAAAIFAVVGSLVLRRRVQLLVEAESGLNDPMAILLTVFLLTLYQGQASSYGHAFFFFGWQLVGGLLVGLGAGFVMVKVLRRMRLDGSGLYPVLTMAGVLGTYGAADLLKASGFLAVYVMGVYLGGQRLPYRGTIVRFQEALAWMSQIVLFTMLGLLVSPSHLATVSGDALLIALGQMLILRPIAVVLSLLGMGYTSREMIWIGWAGLKGAVPIVLATYPLVAGLPHAVFIFDVVFLVVIFSALLQGTTLPYLGKALGLVTGGKPPPTVSLEFVSLEEGELDLAEVTLPEHSPVVGKRLAECAIPETVAVSAIVRQGKVVPPRGGTRLQAGDHLYLWIPQDQGDEFLQRFYPPSDAGSPP